MTTTTSPMAANDNRSKSLNGLRDTVIPHAIFLGIAALLSLQGCSGSSAAAPATPAAAVSAPAVPHITGATSQIEAGRYLVKIGGCNDCHTEGFAETNGAMPAEADWLQGSAIGFSGPWGVSYPANLRLRFQGMTEEEFLTLAHEGKGRPPMPWASLKAMSDDDLRAVYAYVHSLGPKGAMVPAALSPGVEPDRMHVQFVPVMPKAPAKAK